MRTTYIPNTTLRASVQNDCLFVFNDVEDQLILTISSISPSLEELAARNFDSIEEFQNVEIRRILEEELQLESVNIEHLFVA